MSHKMLQNVLYDVQKRSNLFMADVLQHSLLGYTRGPLGVRAPGTRYIGEHCNRIVQAIHQATTFTMKKTIEICRLLDIGEYKVRKTLKTGQIPVYGAMTEEMYSKILVDRLNELKSYFPNQQAPYDCFLLGDGTILRPTVEPCPNAEVLLGTKTVFPIVGPLSNTNPRNCWLNMVKHIFMNPSSDMVVDVKTKNYVYLLTFDFDTCVEAYVVALGIDCSESSDIFLAQHQLTLKLLDDNQFNVQGFIRDGCTTTSKHLDTLEMSHFNDIVHGFKNLFFALVKYAIFDTRKWPKSYGGTAGTASI